MSDDSKPRSQARPLWQQKGQDEKDELGEQSSIGSDAGDTRSDLKAQAARFLWEEEVRNASTEKKIEFLKTKGLDHDEIQELLRAAESTDEKPVVPPIASKEEILEKSARAPDESAGLEQSPSPTTHATSINSPPIITYPEFILHSQKPPPLVTAQRLLTTFYAISGLATLTYGTSKYIAEPMIESLTSARHSFAETTISNIDAFNKKLEEVVSILPNTLPPATDAVAEGMNDTEAGAFFQRSTATQTSPSLSRSSSTTSTDSPRKPSETEIQSTRLHRLQDDLRELLDSALNEQSQGIGLKKDVKHELDALRTFLSHMEFGGTQLSTGEKTKEDGIAKLKAEIRQAKGVLLSSRNFPSSIAARGWGTAAS